jgi:hypothetical protein
VLLFSDLALFLKGYAKFLNEMAVSFVTCRPLWVASLPIVSQIRKTRETDIAVIWSHLCPRLLSAAPLALKQTVIDQIVDMDTIQLPGITTRWYAIDAPSIDTRHIPASRKRHYLG